MTDKPHATFHQVNHILPLRETECLMVTRPEWKRVRTRLEGMDCEVIWATVFAGVTGGICIAEAVSASLTDRAASPTPFVVHLLVSICAGLLTAVIWLWCKQKRETIRVEKTHIRDLLDGIEERHEIPAPASPGAPIGQG